MSEPLKHPASRNPIELKEGEQLYRLAKAKGAIWNLLEPLKLEHWPPPEEAA